MAALTDLILPKLGLTMAEGRLAAWHVKPGDEVDRGDILFVVETDKIANDIDAPGAGRIVEILVPEGDTVPVGTVVARWTGPGLAATDEAPPPVPAAAVPRRIIATPLARRLAKSRALDLSDIPGSGPAGRIKAADVERALAARGRAGDAAVGKPHAAGPTPIARRRKPEPIELLAAHRLAQSTRQIPHFYLSTSPDVTRLVALRADFLPEEPRPSLTHFVICAVARALRDLAWANSIWLDDEIVTFDRVDIAIATDTPRGLMMPMLRDAAALSLYQIERAVRDLAERARRNALSPDDLGGGAVAISSLGMHDIDLVLPIINAPQSAILGIGRVRELFRPDDRGQPTLAKEMPLVLCCDHRIFDGVKGAAVLRRIASYLQHPARLLRA